MTAPVVAVTRDHNGFNTKLSWCESEHRYYWDGVAVELTFDADKNLWWGVTVRASSRWLGSHAALTFAVLTENPWADVTDLCTHNLPEPGAPLEPIHGRAA